MNILDKETQFITSEELLAEVHNMLPSFFERGVLDDSIYYPVIRACLAKLGTKIFPTSSAIIPITDYKGYLPSDFYKLILALGCSQTSGISLNTETPQLYEVKVGNVFEKDFDLDLPNPVLCTDNCGDVYKVVQRINGFEYVYSNIYPLSLKGSSSYCTGGCFNKKQASVNEITIDKKNIYTNFPSGEVYISYLQNLESNDGDLLIPDFAQIREWIKSACVTKSFEKIYWNAEGDVQQRLQYAKQDEAIKEMNARSFARRSEISELYDMRKLFYQRYDKFQQVVYGNQRDTWITY